MENTHKSVTITSNELICILYAMGDQMLETGDLDAPMEEAKRNLYLSEQGNVSQRFIVDEAPSILAALEAIGLGKVNQVSAEAAAMLDGVEPLEGSGLMSNSMVALPQGIFSLREHATFFEDPDSHGINGMETEYLFESADKTNLSFDIDQQNASGQTLLHFAASASSTEAARILLSMGASLNIKDNQGHSPYSPSYIGRYHHGTAVIEMEALFRIHMANEIAEVNIPEARPKGRVM